MSLLLDYQQSLRLRGTDASFAAHIMAAARKADTPNFERLREAFPFIIAELQARYDAPGGRLEGRDVILSYRPIKVRPPEWDHDPWCGSSPFKADWQSTLTLLNHELEALGADDALLQLNIGTDDLTIGGQLRANVRPADPGVILSFLSSDFGTLTYQCRKFSSWHHNVRAIVLGLENLRRLERYGIADRGQQYAGFAELPSGLAAGAKMTVDQAWRSLCEAAGLPLSMPMLGDNVDLVWAMAAKSAHPDVGGDAETFKELLAAKDYVKAHLP